MTSSLSTFTERIRNSSISSVWILASRSRKRPTASRPIASAPIATAPTASAPISSAPTACAPTASAENLSERVLESVCMTFLTSLRQLTAGSSNSKVFFFASTATLHPSGRAIIGEVCPMSRSATTGMSARSTSKSTFATACHSVSFCSGV